MRMPSYVHLTSTWDHSCSNCPRPFPLFCHFCVLYWIQTKEQNRRGLEMRLPLPCKQKSVVDWAFSNVTANFQKSPLNRVFLGISKNFLWIPNAVRCVGWGMAMINCYIFGSWRATNVGQEIAKEISKSKQIHSHTGYKNIISTPEYKHPTIIVDKRHW